MASPRTTVFLPKEHGSWSLALEPLALGLLVAPSSPGAALALATLAGFFARRPLRTSFVPAPSQRRLAARRTLLLWTAMGSLGLIEALSFGSWLMLWPLVPAALLGAVFAANDLRGESRTLVAELSGCAAFALVPAAFATLGGWSSRAALALAFLALARSGPTVLLVRGRLRRTKGQITSSATPIVAALAALAVTCGLVGVSLLPALVLLPISLLAVRALWFESPWAPRWSARRVGIFESILGVLCLALTAAAFCL